MNNHTTHSCGCACQRHGRADIPTADVLLKKIAQCEFICIDINLYLNTHPCDGRALDDYNCYAQQLRALKALYEENYGPLQNFGNSVSHGCWNWAKQPFPWKKQCKTED